MDRKIWHILAHKNPQREREKNHLTNVQKNGKKRTSCKVLFFPNPFLLKVAKLEVSLLPCVALKGAI